MIRRQDHMSHIMTVTNFLKYILLTDSSPGVDALLMWDTGHHEELGERGGQNIKCNAMNLWMNSFFSNVPLPFLVGAAVTLIHPDICSTVTVTILNQVVSEIFEIFRWLETLTRTVLDIQTSAKTSVPQSFPSQIPLLPGGTRATVELHL